MRRDGPRVLGQEQPGIAAVAIAPGVRERVNFTKLRACCKEEQGSARAVRDMQLAQRFLHRPRAVLIGRHREDAECLPTEMLDMLFGGIRGQIGAHFPLEAGLPDIAARDRHRTTVDLDDKGMAGAIGEHQAEHKIGDQPDVMERAPIRERYPQREGIALAEGLIGKGGNHLGWMDEPKARASLRRPLQRHVKIDDLKLVLDEGASGLPVFAAPFDVGKIDAVALDEKPCAAVGQGVGDRRRAGSGVVVELRPRPVDIA